MTKFGVVRATAPAALALSLLAAAPASASGVITSIGTDSITIPFAGGVVNGRLVGSPAITVGLNGGPLQKFIMDTGSAGMVVTPDVYTPPLGSVPAYTNVVQAYASNGIMYTGDVYYTPIQIGSGAQSILTNTPLLVASSVQCIPGVACGTPSLTNWRFMGVGFGESSTGTTTWPLNTTQRNPLFNVTQINGQSANPSKGWIMGSTGITVGLTAANIVQFALGSLDTLTPSSDGFNRGRASVAINGGPAAIGSVLVDSGLHYAYLQPSLADVPATVSGDPTNPFCRISGLSCTAPGNTVTISLGDPASPAVTYSVVVGTDGSLSSNPDPAAAPEFIRQIPATTLFPYWNTSFNFFNAYDYLFDAADGVVGYAAVNQVPGPLPLGAAAAAWRCSRSLRRRLRRGRDQGVLLDSSSLDRDS